VIIVGEAPGATLLSLLRGAFGDLEGVGYTLFFATDYVFAGLAVALPYRAGLFNIGSEGQAALGGLGATLVVLYAPASACAYGRPGLSRSRCADFGKWRPWPVFAACLFFAAADEMQARLQSVTVPGIAAVPVQLIQAVPYGGDARRVCRRGTSSTGSRQVLSSSRMTSSHQKVRLLREVCAQTSC
jgi:hypothetical protein